MRTLAIALGAWRVAVMLAVEPGPNHVFHRLREAYPDQEPVILTPSGPREFLQGVDNLDDAMLVNVFGPRAEVGRLLRCMYCSSVWLSVVLGWLDRRGGSGVVDALAAAGVVMVALDTHQVVMDWQESVLLHAPIPGGDLANAAD